MSKKLKPRDKITQKNEPGRAYRGQRNRRHRRAGQRARAGRGFFQAARTGGAGSRAAASAPSGSAAARPHTPELSPKRDDAAAERVLSISTLPIPAASKKAIKRAQREAAAKTKTSRLQFTEGRTGDAGASKGDPQIGKSRRPLGRSAGGYSEKESLDKRAHL